MNAPDRTVHMQERAPWTELSVEEVAERACRTFVRRAARGVTDFRDARVCLGLAFIVLLATSSACVLFK